LALAGDLGIVDLLSWGFGDLDEPEPGIPAIPSEKTNAKLWPNKSPNPQLPKSPTKRILTKKMNLDIQTPALLFPAVSLLLLAYTNKFLAIASLIRKLVSDYEKKQKHGHLKQIRSLRRRLMLIRWMQVCGVASMLLCVVTMYFVYEGWQVWAKVLFATSLLLLMASLVITILEIMLSAGALRVILKDFEERNK
jgi:hypothetical protein